MPIEHLLHKFTPHVKLSRKVSSSALSGSVVCGGMSGGVSGQSTHSTTHLVKPRNLKAQECILNSFETVRDDSSTCTGNILIVAD